jgi:cytochrome oxidase Cu insertion factor (SCO1/SenC/PrrC family)
MEDRLMQRTRGPALAVAALAAILAITAAWWALALWPLPATTPEWLVRARQACFGNPPGGLPHMGGWIVLVGSPLGLLAALAVVWGDELRAGLGALAASFPGQLALGAAAACLTLGGAWAAGRVSDASAEPFAVDGRDGAAALAGARVDDPIPITPLVDQRGAEVRADAFPGRPVLVTFAFAHCQTVCPVVVHDVLNARDREPAANAVVLVVTLDPWRDTPSRLPSIAEGWGLTGDAHVLSGDPETVEQVLTRWRVPRLRNAQTGDVTHPAMVYVVRDGRIRYALPGGEEGIRAALRAVAAG